MAYVYSTAYHLHVIGREAVFGYFVHPDLTFTVYM